MKIRELLPKLSLHGRTVYDEKREALFFNWSCSGFTVVFTGKILKAYFTPMGDEIPAPPGMPANPVYYPYVGVVLDDGETLTGRQECREEGWYTLWQSDQVESHVFRVVKVTENARGKLGLLELETDGEFLQAPFNQKPTIEIVGDSITCGFGNEAANNDPEYRNSEENGWMSYAAIAARELGYEFSLISESSISVCQPQRPFIPIHAMDEIYHLTDELYDSRRGVEPACWDFDNHHSDIVVLNLGTNDANPMRFYQDISDVDAMEVFFEKQYRKFIEQVRSCNGKDTFIVCTLGSMDYYLYDHIASVVRNYQEETGDKYICVFKLVGINAMLEGYGAVGHPSMKTHTRMGRELAWRLRKHVLQND